MKLSQEELFLLSQIYEDGMDKKSVIVELSIINEEGEFIKNLMAKMESLGEDELKFMLNDGILSLNL